MVLRVQRFSPSSPENLKYLAPNLRKYKALNSFGLWVLAQWWIWTLVSFVFFFPAVVRGLEDQGNAIDSRLEILVSTDFNKSLEAIMSELAEKDYICRELTDIHAGCVGLFTFELKQKSNSVSLNTSINQLISQECQSFKQLVECFEVALGDQILRVRPRGSNLVTLDLEDRRILVSPVLVTLSMK